MAEAGKAVIMYFEEKLLEIFPDQTFPVVAEEPRADGDEEAAEDSDDDFVQPKRKRLKVDVEKLMYIK